MEIRQGLTKLWQGISGFYGKVKQISGKTKRIYAQEQILRYPK